MLIVEPNDLIYVFHSYPTIASYSLPPPMWRYHSLSNVKLEYSDDRYIFQLLK